MKKFKKIDFIIQIILISSALVANLVRQSDILGEFFLFSYVVVGGWQLLSVVIHFIRPIPVKISLRRIYLVLLGLTIFVGVFIAVIATDVILIFFLGLLFFSPVLAILYVVTCFKENEKLNLLPTN